MIATRTKCSAPLALLVLFFAYSSVAFEMEMGSVTVADTFSVPAWTSVVFQQSFATRPIVFVLPTNEGGDPSTVRIRNVTATGFEVVQTEPPANDGPHVAMNTAYLAIEPGDHQLPDGTRIAAIEHTTTSFANRLVSTTWDGVFFPSAFSAAPVVLGSIQTTSNESGTPPATSSNPFMDVGIRNVTPTSLQVTLERAESTAGSVTIPERIGILAIDNFANVAFVDASSTAVQLQSLATSANVQGWDNGCFANSYAVPFALTPLAVASAMTRNGNNGGWIRRCNQSSASLSLTVDEDIDNDSERSHIGEAAGIVAASVAFHANFEVDLAISKAVDALSDPINGTTNPKAIPTSTVGYTVSVANSGSSSPDNNSLVVTDTIPGELSLCVTPACLSGGPVIFDDSASPVATGVTLDSVEYSNDGGASYTYSPAPDADGFDPMVDAVRITLTGTLSSIGTGGSPSFELLFAARVD